MSAPLNVRVCRTISYRRDRARPWYVRWTVNGVERGPKTFETEDSALNYAALLRVAVQEGKKWDLATGLPASWSPLSKLDVASYCRHFWAKRTRTLKPRSKSSWAETLSRFVVAAMPARAGAMPGTYGQVIGWLTGDTSHNTKLDAWLTRWSPSMSSLDERKLERVHDALMLDVNGKDLGAAALHRRFTHAHALLRAAVKDGLIEADELVSPTKEEYAQRASTRSLKFPELSQMLDVVEAIVSHQPASHMYRAMSAIGVLAGLRPSEIVALEVGDLTLPEAGFGMIHVVRARTGLAGYCDDSEEIGAPKSRRSTREVPIPPTLVEVLRAWVDGRQGGPLFRTRTGEVPKQGNWIRALNRATRLTNIRPLTPYDLRRFHATWMAESGVPYNEAARRMGHSLEVFMRVYVHTTDSVEAVANAAIERALG